MKKKHRNFFIIKHVFFKKTPIEVYEYMIGDQQVLRSYLLCRKGRKLNIYEIKYLEKVIKILNYTIEKQKEIDKIISDSSEFGI